ncbi:MAG: protein kinase, partial [Chloroflexota bacterium]
MAVGVLSLTAGIDVDQYTLEEQVGSGSSGEVWRATVDGEVFALKFLNERLLTGDEADLHLKRFRGEILALEEVGHGAYIPQLHGYNLNFERPYLAMTYVDAPRWADLILSGEMMQVSLVKRLELLTQLAEAMHMIHDYGFVHRDVKPGNIHGVDHPYLIDFSVAVQVGAANTADHVGTAIYMPPPDGKRPDAMLDNYAFAVVVYEMLFGFHPIFSASYQPGSLDEAREETRARLSSGEWGRPSTLSDAKLPGSLLGANLERLETVFRRGLGPREERYRDLKALIRDVEAAVLTEAN